MTDWQRIVDKYGLLVWQRAYRLLGNEADAADCFSETFVSALEVSRRQRVRSFPALLARLATMRAIDKLRQRCRQVESKIDKTTADANVVPSNDPGPMQQAQMRELAGRLRETLGRLPSQEAEVFCMRYLNDMSYRQIGKELGIKTNAAGVLLHRAKLKLRSLLETTADQEKM